MYRGDFVEVRYLKKYMFKYKKLILITCIAMIIGIVFSLFPPIIISRAVDSIEEGKLHLLKWFCILIVVAGIVEGAVSFVQQYYSKNLGNRVSTDIRYQLFTHINSMSFKYFDKSDTGDIMTRLVGDVNNISSFIGFGLFRLIINIFTIIGILIVLMRWNLLLGIEFLLFIPLMVILMYQYSNKISGNYKKMRVSTSKLNSKVKEIIANIELVKSLGKEEKELRKVEEASKTLRDNNIDSYKIIGFWLPMVRFLLNIILLVIVLTGGYLVIEGKISTGILMGSISYVSILMRPIRQSGRLIGQYRRYKVSMERLEEILQEYSYDKKDDGQKEGIDGNIEFNGVSFSYIEGEEILRDINFKISKGMKVAIVGKSGAGKSTIAKLIPRFYSDYSGKIRVGQHEISDYSTDYLRNKVVSLLQDPFIFSGSIKDNLIYGNEHVSMKKLCDVIEACQLKEYIDSLPYGLNTSVGEKGIKLSGGQLHRIALARILLSSPEIFVLDEPTSNIDAKTDMNIMKSVEKYLLDKTAIIIAHTKWTIKNADMIIVLENGTIEGSGTFDQLIESSDTFNKLFKESMD
jgi:ABC-type multidrug transport system fused ATPase/permease subunit